MAWICWSHQECLKSSATCYTFSEPYQSHCPCQCCACQSHLSQPGLSDHTTRVHISKVRLPEPGLSQSILEPHLSEADSSEPELSKTMMGCTFITGIVSNYVHATLIRPTVIKISQKHFCPGGMALSECTGSARAIRDTLAADYSAPGAKMTHRVAYCPPIAVSPFLLAQ